MVNTGKSDPFQIFLDIISPSTFVDFWKNLTRRLNVANSNKNRKKSSWGCFWAFLILTFLGFLAFLALGAGATYLYVKASEDPQKFLKNYEVVVRQVGDYAVDLASSDEPMLSEDTSFDADAYNQFVQKVGQFQQIINDPNATDIPLKLNYTAKELINGFKQDLVRYDITRYELNFEKGIVHAKASIKGEILTPYIPAEFPEVLRKSLETIQWINIDVKMSALFDESLTVLAVEKLRLGDFNSSQFVIQKLNELLAQYQQRLNNELIRRLRATRLKPQKINFEKDRVNFEGLYNPSQ